MKESKLVSIKDKVLEIGSIENTVLKRVLDSRVCENRFRFHNEKHSDHHTDERYSDSHVDDHSDRYGRHSDKLGSGWSGGPPSDSGYMEHTDHMPHGDTHSDYKE